MPCAYLWGFFVKHENFNAVSTRGADAAVAYLESDFDPQRVTERNSALFGLSKRFFDLVVCVLLLLPTVLVGAVLLLLNPVFNRGPLFFVQERMGADCKPFRALKFRTMTCAIDNRRGAEDPLETDRITRLGSVLRKARIDELPQIFNVFAGQMSLIGPRPDSFEHAKVYLQAIPEYRLRHSVLPGISGFAQTEVGYVEGIEATRRKVDADLYYIANRNLRMEAWLVWRTIKTMVSRAGA